MEYLLDRIKELSMPVLEAHSIDLVDLKLQRQNRRVFLRFFVDKPEGGITLDKCADLNTEISLILDEADLIQERFILEVSSPGLDRPLATAKDFKRALNRDIKIYLAEPIENRLEFLGNLQSVEEERINILVDGRIVIIPINIINKAKQVIQ
jgi:ribosome maturation factor RimP